MHDAEDVYFMFLVFFLHVLHMLGLILPCESAASSKMLPAPALGRWRGGCFALSIGFALLNSKAMSCLVLGTFLDSVCLFVSRKKVTVPFKKLVF